jgi:integrase/recombinase XerD
MKTLHDLLKDHLVYMLSIGYGRKYLYKRERTILNFLRWLEEQYHVHTADRIRRKHLHAWQTYLHEYRTWRGLPYAPTAINQLVMGVKGFLTWLARESYVQRSLTDVLELVKEPSLLPTSVLTHQQMRRLLSKIPTDDTEGFRDRTMLEMLYSTGVRVGELLGLDLPHVDLKNATALVYGKGSKQRVVPIGKTALRYLESYIVAVRPFLLRDKSEKAYFLNRKGRRMHYLNFLKRVHVYADRAGLQENVTPHTFRRSCTTELIRGGANMYHVKELLGHEDLDTLKHYAKLTIHDLKKTHEKCHPREHDNAE